jgi:hypothetical protein
MLTDTFAAVILASLLAGGNIRALSTFLGESSQNREVTIKVAGLDSQSLVSTVEPLVERIIDIRESERSSVENST